jgi:uncharacterized protein YbaR (Trm112 family)
VLVALSAEYISRSLSQSKFFPSNDPIPVLLAASAREIRLELALISANAADTAERLLFCSLAGRVFPGTSKVTDTS